MINHLSAKLIIILFIALPFYGCSSLNINNLPSEQQNLYQINNSNNDGYENFTRYPNDPIETDFRDSKFRVTVTSRENPVEADLVLIRRDLVEIRLRDSGALTEFPKSDLISVHEETKGESKTGTIIGSLIGAVAGAIISSSTASTEVEGNIETTTYSLWPVYIGVGVGAGIGSFLQRSKTKEWIQVYPLTQESENMEMNSN